MFGAVDGIGASFAVAVSILFTGVFSTAEFRD